MVAIALDVWSSIGSTLSAAGLTIVVVLALFGLAPKFIGEKLFGHYLDGRIARLKHDQGKELEAIRERLSHLSDRGVRSNEREYLALSSVWEKFVDLYYATNVCAVSYIQFPDLDRCSDAEVEEFLSTTELSDQQKSYVKKAADKNRSYSSSMTWRYITKAQSQVFETRLLIHKHGIFVPTPLRDELFKAVDLCNSAIAQRYAEQNNSPLALEHIAVFLKDGPNMLETVKELVRVRLHRE